MTQEVLNRIAVFYAIEAGGRNLTAEGRKRLREERSQPALAALHDWLQQTRLRTEFNAAIAKAIDYTLKRWTALARYAETGDYPSTTTPSKTAFVRLP